MTLALTHAFVSGKADGSDATQIQPSHWNAALSTSMATARLLGRVTAGTGAIEELTAANLRDSFLPAGSIIDSAYAEYLTNTALSTVIPVDDTIPQNTEGTQILSVSITPKTTTNKVRVRFAGWGACDSAGINYLIAALFLNSGANAIAGSIAISPAANYVLPFPFEFEHVPASTSAQTYSLRVGPGLTGNIRMNGNTAQRLLGGIGSAILSAQEIKV